MTGYEWKSREMSKDSPQVWALSKKDQLWYQLSGEYRERRYSWCKRREEVCDKGKFKVMLTSRYDACCSNTQDAEIGKQPQVQDKV